MFLPSSSQSRLGNACSISKRIVSCTRPDVRQRRTNSFGVSLRRFFCVRVLKHSQATEYQSQNVIEEDDSSDEIYNVSELLSPSLANVQLTEVQVSLTHACSMIAPCQWVNEGTSETCGAEISCGAVIVHFRNTHGIRRLEDSAKIRCLWKGCPKRIGHKNFLRHIAEHHLRHPRS